MKILREYNEKANHLARVASAEASEEGVPVQVLSCPSISEQVSITTIFKQVSVTTVFEQVFGKRRSKNIWKKESFLWTGNQ
jgi:hypothetical protein